MLKEQAHISQELKPIFLVTLLTVAAAPVCHVGLGCHSVLCCRCCQIAAAIPAILCRVAAAILCRVGLGTVYLGRWSPFPSSSQATTAAGVCCVCACRKRKRRRARSWRPSWATATKAKMRGGAPRRRCGSRQTRWQHCKRRWEGGDWWQGKDPELSLRAMSDYFHLRVCSLWQWSLCERWCAVVRDGMQLQGFSGSTTVSRGKAPSASLMLVVHL
eukprot:773196-Pelagomonas_calceolata.AAC.4